MNLELYVELVRNINSLTNIVEKLTLIAEAQVKKLNAHSERITYLEDQLVEHGILPEFRP